MPDFGNLLRRPADSFEKPKPLPAGSYFGTITKRELGESKNKKTPYVRYTIAPTGPGEDIDPADMEGIDLSKKQLFKDFYLTDDATFRLREFIESLGHETTGRSLGEIIEDPLNATVLFQVSQRAGQREGDIFNDVGDVSGA